MKTPIYKVPFPRTDQGGKIDWDEYPAFQKVARSLQAEINEHARKAKGAA